MEGFSCPTQERFDDMAEEATNDASMPDYKRIFYKDMEYINIKEPNINVLLNQLTSENNTETVTNIVKNIVQTNNNIIQNFDNFTINSITNK